MTKFADLAHVPEDVSQVFDVDGDPIIRVKGDRWSVAYRANGKAITPEGFAADNPAAAAFGPFTLKAPKESSNRS